MCGIVGYTGMLQASPILVAGLRRLEYRGYDSAGVAAIDEAGLTVRKRAGRVRVLEEMLAEHPLRSHCGISHTRWATHGPANDRNAHPHLGGRGGRATVAVVHNGVIENHAPLRRELESEGFVFLSQTDTEVVAHLIARELERTSEPFEAVQRISAPTRGDVWPGRALGRSPRRADRRAVRQSAGRGRGGRRTSARQRRRGHRTSYGPGRLPARRRGRPADAARVRDPPSRARFDHSANRSDRLEARRG